MVSSRSLDRLLAFSDATVAIAITLLVLPLVDVAQEAQDRPVADVLDQHTNDFVSFGLSFVVIAAFWRVHHSMYDDLDRSTPAIVTANLAWLATIVFLPFPTELLGSDSDERLTHGIYIGTLVAAAAAQSVQRWLILRETSTSVPLRADLVTLGLMIASLVVAVSLPVIGMWSLLVLLLTSPIMRLLRNRTTT